VGPRDRLRRGVAVAAWSYLGAVAVVALALWLLTDRWWPITVIAFAPRWIWALPLLGLLPASAMLGRRHLAPLVASIPILLFAVLDLRLGLGAGAVNGGPRLKVVTYNVGGVRSREMLVRMLQDTGADIVGMPECQIHQRGPSIAGFTLRRDGGTCLLSRYPIRTVDVRDPHDVWAKGGSGVILRYEIDTPGGLVNLLLVHLETVRSGLEVLPHALRSGRRAMIANLAQRNWESDLARTWLRRSGQPLIVLGDFNLPVESAIYRRHWGDLDNAFSRCGRGFGASKHTSWHGIRIDHVLYDAGFVCLSATVGTAVGGDHSPIVTELGFTPRR
jgi:endonuclease/exonuclease/phosphatase (EEP) superfamily protein YafD